jgi:hypothetical protein
MKNTKHGGGRGKVLMLCFSWFIAVLFEVGGETSSYGGTENSVGS